MKINRTLVLFIFGYLSFHCGAVYAQQQAVAVSFDHKLNPESYFAIKFDDLSKIPSNFNFKNYVNVTELVFEVGSNKLDSAIVQGILNQFKEINKITHLTVPTNYELSGFANLKTLNWNHNGSSSKLNESILSIKSLEKLKLSIKDLDHIPDLIFELEGLKELTLVFNTIYETNDERWLKLHNLYSLTLNYKEYGHYETGNFPKGFLEIPTLKHLKIHTSDNVGFPYDLTIVNRIKTIEIKCSSVSNLEVLLRCSPHVTEISIHSANYVSPLPWYLFQYLINYPSLKLLVISPKYTNLDIIRAIEYTIRLNDYKGEKQLISPMRWRRLKKKLLKTHFRENPADNYYNQYQQFIFKEQ